MHHIKSSAKWASYSDPMNPFARVRPKRTGSSAVEEGRPGDLTQTRSVPHDSRPGSAFEKEFFPARNVSMPSQAATGAVPRQRAIHQGDDINIPQTASPMHSPNLAASNEKHVREMEISNVSESTEQPFTGRESYAGTKSHPDTGMSDVDLGTTRSRDNDHNNGKDKPKPKFTVMGQLRATLFNSWINVLLICCPIGIALNFAGVPDVAIFVVNFIAIIPLAGLLSYATEEIALRTGEVFGGLLNATFGNAVELIVSIIALVKNQIIIVQTSLIGSMLSNLLLVMGMSFFFGGVSRVEQAFNVTVAQTAASLLFLAVSSLIIPTAFEAWATTNADQTSGSNLPVRGVLELSRGTAVLLLLVYACYLFFQLKSHVSMYSLPSEKNNKRDFTAQKSKWAKRTGVMALKQKKRAKFAPSDEPESPVSSNREEEEEAGEEPQLSLTVAILTLAISTVLVAVNSEFLVGSINGITCDGGISQDFVGLILLPIVGNAAEHATAVTVAIKDKMDLSIGVAVGSSLQIALLVLPFVVVVGWIIGERDGQVMSLYFDGFQIAVLFVAVVLVNYLISDGKSHWLEGVMLMILYIIIAVAAWFYPLESGECGAK